mgnify:FL=1|jgi:hypothetical protein
MAVIRLKREYELFIGSNYFLTLYKVVGATLYSLEVK